MTGCAVVVHQAVLTLLGNGSYVGSSPRSMSLRRKQGMQNRQAQANGSTMSSLESVAGVSRQKGEAALRSPTSPASLPSGRDAASGPSGCSSVTVCYVPVEAGASDRRNIVNVQRLGFLTCMLCRTGTSRA